MVSFFKGGDFVEINNSLPIIDYSDNETGCCPKFRPENWDEKIFNFDELKFIKASTKSFMHMPINMGSVMTKPWSYSRCKSRNNRAISYTFKGHFKLEIQPLFFSSFRCPWLRVGAIVHMT